MDAERLRYAIARKGISQKEIAEMLGTTQASVSRWVMGTREPSDRRKYQLASILDVTVGYLMGEEELFPTKDRIFHQIGSRRFFEVPLLQRDEVAKLWENGKLVPSEIAAVAQLKICCDKILLDSDLLKRNYENLFAITTSYERGEVDNLESDGINDDAVILIDMKGAYVQGGLALVHLASMIVLKHIYTSGEGESSVLLKDDKGKMFLMEKKEREFFRFGILGIPILIFSVGMPIWPL